MIYIYIYNIQVCIIYIYVWAHLYICILAPPWKDLPRGRLCCSKFQLYGPGRLWNGWSCASCLRGAGSEWEIPVMVVFNCVQKMVRVSRFSMVLWWFYDVWCHLAPSWNPHLVLLSSARSACSKMKESKGQTKGQIVYHLKCWNMHW